MYGGITETLSNVPFEGPSGLSESQQIVQRILGQLENLEMRLDPVLGGPLSPVLADQTKQASAPSQIIIGLTTINQRLAGILDRINV